MKKITTLSEWFYADGEKPLGPYNKEEIKALYSIGVIMDETLVYNESLSNWSPISKVNLTESETLFNETEETKEQEVTMFESFVQDVEQPKKINVPKSDLESLEQHAPKPHDDISIRVKNEPEKYDREAAKTYKNYAANSKQKRKNKFEHTLITIFCFFLFFLCSGLAFDEYNNTKLNSNSEYDSNEDVEYDDELFEEQDANTENTIKEEVGFIKENDTNLVYKETEKQKCNIKRFIGQVSGKGLNGNQLALRMAPSRNAQLVRWLNYGETVQISNLFVSDNEGIFWAQTSDGYYVAGGTNEEWYIDVFIETKDGQISDLPWFNALAGEEN